MRRPSTLHAACLATTALALLTTGAHAQYVQDDPRRVIQGEGFRDLISLADAPRRGPLHPVRVNGWWGLMDDRGRLIVYPQFEWLDDPFQHLVRFARDGVTGFAMQHGRVVIDPVWPYADRFSEDFALVGDGERFGFIDRSGDLHVPLLYDQALRFREDVAAVMRDGFCGFIDEAGEVAVPLRYVAVRSFHDGRAAVATETPGAPRWSYIDRNDRRLWDAPAEVEALGDYSDGMARVRINGRWGYIDRNYKGAIEPFYDEARDFFDGAAAVRQGDQWGYINKQGDWLIEPRYEEAYDFDAPVAMVRQNGLYGYIDKSGREVISPQFPDAHPFFRDRARVWLNGEWAYIDRSGRLIWDPAMTAAGFVDLRFRERVTLQLRRRNTFNRIVAPPPQREPVEPPYVADYLYEESLPKPPGEAP